MTADRPAPRALTVVVAAHDAQQTVVRCLGALDAQGPEAIAEIVVVASSRDSTPDLVRQQMSGAQVPLRLVEIPPTTEPVLTPRLWAEGFLATDGDVVALLTAEMEPRPGWARALLDAYAAGLWAGVGGPILPGDLLRQQDAAVYWLRYHRFAAARPAGVVRDIAGDNGSYRRAALAPYLDQIRQDGFWEHELNQQLVASGEQLFSTPGACVRYLGGEAYDVFARQRLIHGARFGEQRMANLRGSRRLMLLGAWPLTPAVFLLRIVREVAAVGGLASLARALPRLLWLLGCWSVGELRGYLAALGPRAKAGAPGARSSQATVR